MAFTVANLSVIGVGQKFTLWHYRAMERSLQDVSEPSFFAEARDMISGGDMMMVSARDGGQVLYATAQEGRLRMAPLH